METETSIKNIKFLSGILIVSLIGFLDALYLTYSEITGTYNCLIDQGAFSCLDVNTSKWSMFLGVHVSIWGVIFYLSVIALTLLAQYTEKQNNFWLSVFLPLISLWGVGFSLYLTIIEAFVLKAYCEFCLLSALCSIVLLLFVLLTKKKVYDSITAKLNVWEMLQKGDNSTK